ncbi:MAG TPA: hypothetical protein VGR43_02145 [Dehalococcoidia bacterium]|jgi:hypothetical protein|nr:hypothetical protein [Dehalococcoidia bacterium]
MKVVEVEQEVVGMDRLDADGFARRGGKSWVLKVTISSESACRALPIAPPLFRCPPGEYG